MAGGSAFLQCFDAAKVSESAYTVSIVKKNLTTKAEKKWKKFRRWLLFDSDFASFILVAGKTTKQTKHGNKSNEEKKI